MYRWVRTLFGVAVVATAWTLWQSQLTGEALGNITPPSSSGKNEGKQRSESVKKENIPAEGSTFEGFHITSGSWNTYISSTYTKQDPWTAEQDRRKAAVARACQGWRSNLKANLPMTRADLSSVLVDDHHEAIYCYVPKVACSNWKRIWMILTGVSKAANPLDISREQAHLEDDKMMLVKQPYNTTFLQRKLYTYTKLLVVRDPYERLLSAFRDKFEGEGELYYQKNFGYHIMKKYRQNVRDADIPKSGKGVTFVEFVRNIIDHPSEVADEHWKPYAQLCYPCAIHYDVIAKYETLVEDSERFLRLIGAPQNLHFPAYKPSSTSALLSSYMGNLSKRQRESLRRIYQKDFQMFQYQD